MDILFDHDLELNELCGKTDEELVELAKTKRDAAAVLLSRFYKIISVKAVIYSNSSAESDDLRQEGLLSLFLAMNSYDSSRGAKFATFAEVCIENKMKTVAARASRKNFGSESRGDLSEAEDISDRDTPESIYLYKEFIGELWEKIGSTLSPIEIQAFRLHMQGLNYSAAAEKLGVSEKSVDNAVQRARKKIRAIINRLNMAV